MLTPAWLTPGARVWFYRTRHRVDGIDELGVVVAFTRRGLKLRRLLKPDDVEHALASGELRLDTTPPRRARRPAVVEPHLTPLRQP